MDFAKRRQDTRLSSVVFNFSSRAWISTCGSTEIVVSCHMSMGMTHRRRKRTWEIHSQHDIQHDIPYSSGHVCGKSLLSGWICHENLSHRPAKPVAAAAVQPVPGNIPRKQLGMVWKWKNCAMKLALSFTIHSYFTYLQVSPVHVSPINGHIYRYIGFIYPSNLYV